MPALYLLAWDRLESVRIGPGYVALGLAVGVVLFLFVRSSGQDDLVPWKLTLLVTDSVVAAGLLLAAYGVRRWPSGAAALAALVAITNGYAAACAYGEDAQCLLAIARVHDRWGARILAAMPEPEVALIGWHYAEDAVFHVRAEKPVVVVDPSVDDAASLPETIDALVASGRTPYYFGLELPRVQPHIEERYRVVQVLDNPLLWRFNRVATDAAGKASERPPR